MNSVTFTLNQTCNPFSINAPVDLVNTSSGKAANEETKKFFLGTLDGGGNCDSNLKVNVQCVETSQSILLSFQSHKI